MTLTNEQALAHFGAILEAEPGWDGSLQALLDAENDLVPLLLETVKAQWDKNETGTEYDKGRWRITRALAAFGDARCLLFFLRLAQDSPTTENYCLLADHLTAIERRASTQDIMVLLDLLTRSAPVWNGPNQPIGNVMGHLSDITPHHRVQLAATLVRIAERDPKPELRAALPLLRHVSISTPFEFVFLHRRLKNALGRNALPIPASAELKTDNLPVPTQEE